MATAWETLTGNSTLTEGTAWEHLQNQQGGGGGDPVYLTTDKKIYYVQDTIELEDSILDDIIVEVVESEDPQLEIISVKEKTKGNIIKNDNSLEVTGNNNEGEVQ